MPGPSFTERYVIARDSNVLRVDFARQPEPPAPQFPGAGALRPSRSNGSGRAASSVCFFPTCGGGWVGGGWSALLCCHPPPCPFPARGEGRGTGFGASPERGWARPQSDFDGLAIYLRPVRHGQERGREHVDCRVFDRVRHRRRHERRGRVGAERLRPLPVAMSLPRRPGAAPAQPTAPHAPDSMLI